MKYSTKSLYISSKPLKRSLYCRSSLFAFQALVGSPVSRACLKRLSTLVPGRDSPTQPIFYQVLPPRPPFHGVCCDFLEASTLTFQCKTLRLTGSLFRRSAIAWGKGLPRLLPQYNTFCIWVLLLLLLFLFCFFCILNFFESKCYSPNESYSKLWAKLY